MATAISKLEITIFLLLKVIEAQGSLKSLDVTRTSEEWPVAAGVAITPRGIHDRLRDTAKDAIAKGLVRDNFSIPRANLNAAKAKGGASGQKGQRGVTTSKKRAKEEEDEDDVMEIEMMNDDASRDKKVKTEMPATLKETYLSPPATVKTRSRHTINNSATIASRAVRPAPKAVHSARQKPCEIEVEDGAPVSDSDSDSLAGLGDTPTKSSSARKRTLPPRQSRAARKSYAADEVMDAGELEESGDEFDPYKIREEQKKREARKNRGRFYMDE